MKISIIIIEYNSLDEIKRCAESAQKHLFYELEIVVSSNSCYAKEIQEEIALKYPRFKWCFNEINGGFAYAMNQGMKLAFGDYLIIANPDCVFIDNLDDMLAFLQQHPEIGAIAPQIVDEEGQIQDSCRHYVSVQSFLWRQARRVITRKEVLLDPCMDYGQIQTVDWVIGAFIMVTRSAYELTGGLSEDYFMYSEDLDWCTRIRLSGLEVVYYPKLRIQYKGTRSARKNSRSALVFLKSAVVYWKRYGFFCGYPRRRKIEYK